MAFAAHAIRPSGVCVPSCSGNGGLEGGAFSWSFPDSRGFVSWPHRCGHISWRDGELLSCSTGVGENLGFSSRRREGKGKQRQQQQQRSSHLSCSCFYYVAHSQVSETEKRKVPKEGLKKGRKNKIEDEEDAEIVMAPSNGFLHAEQPVDDRSETHETENPVERKRTRKKRETTEKTAGSSSSTAAARKVGKKKADSLETIQGGDSSSNASDTGVENSLGPQNYGNFAETKDESAVAVGRGNYSDSATTGEMTKGVDDSNGLDNIVGNEVDYRLLFLESIMERARSGDVEGVEEALSEMEISGINPGPRAFHGLVVSYTRARDAEGAVQALRRELASVERPLPETFVALARLFGFLGQAFRGEEILAVMEKLKHDPRVAWMILIEELKKSGHLEEANVIFFKGADGGLRATPELYNTLIEENAKSGDHGNAVNVMRSLEYAGFQPTTFHHNCLLMCQANANVPEVAASTFEDMQYGPDEMKPDTESYNWLLQAHIRHSRGDRVQEVVDLVGEMVEDHKRVQPNLRTYSLLVECFTKYNAANEAVRYFRALSRLPGGTRHLHNEGNHGDPLSLYLRSLCLEGRAVDLLEALETMVRDGQNIPARAMHVNAKGRTLVSSWIEPIGAEADLGYEVDYISRYLAEGGSTGTRKRWSDLEGGSEDSEGFSLSAPVEVSFRQYAGQMRRRYTIRLIRKLRAEGVLALGPGATDEDVVRVMSKLRKEVLGDMMFQLKKPKAASKMLVNELKEELEAQGLPTDGTRPVLYQRVQKARRINRARGRPLWVPETEEEKEEDQEDDDVDIFMQRLNLDNDHTEFWRKRLTGEDQETELFQVADSQESAEFTEEEDSEFADEDEDDTDDDGEEAEENEELSEDAAEDDPETPELLALKLMKKKSEAAAEEQARDDQEAQGGQWVRLTFQQKIAKLRNEKLLDPAEIYTIADVWGWAWEREIRAKEPDRWTQEHEVQLGMQLMQRVIDLGSVPTIGDCAMLVHAAMRIPWPEAIVSLIQQTHKLGYKFGSKLYNDVVKLLIGAGEKDAAIAIMAEMEEIGLSAPSDLINTVLMESVEVETKN